MNHETLVRNGLAEEVLWWTKWKRSVMSYFCICVRYDFGSYCIWLCLFLYRSTTWWLHLLLARSLLSDQWCPLGGALGYKSHSVNIYYNARKRTSPKHLQSNILVCASMVLWNGADGCVCSVKLNFLTPGRNHTPLTVSIPPPAIWGDFLNFPPWADWEVAYSEGFQSRGQQRSAFRLPHWLPVLLRHWRLLAWHAAF